jgi:hypothetical protein
MHSILRLIIGASSARWLLICGLPLALSAMFTGCRTLPPAPSVNLAETGWVIRQGQAVWSPEPGKPDVAGDLLVAMHRDGRSVVQFTKPPLPFAVAQRGSNFWHVQFFAQKKSYSGQGDPPSRIIWLQLPDGLIGRHSDTNWFLARKQDGSWHFENLVNEEMLDGFLTTTSLPKTHVVHRGESVSRLARWYGVSAEALRAANPGRDFEWFRVGNEIALPPPASATTPPP